MRLIIHQSEVVNSWMVIVFKHPDVYAFGRGITTIYNRIRIIIPDFALLDDFNETRE